MKETTMFLAFFRFDYEGIYEDSIKLFKSKKLAKDYITKLKEGDSTSGCTFEIKELLIFNETNYI